MERGDNAARNFEPAKENRGVDNLEESGVRAKTREGSDVINPGKTLGRNVRGMRFRIASIFKDAEEANRIIEERFKK